ncbi:MAG: hypothetical protein DRG25_03235, partial [Deltaproteobacteria bacterium]
MKKLLAMMTLFFLLLFLQGTKDGKAGTITYTYDDAGRLIKEDFGDGNVIEYTYDNAGNILQKTVKTGQAPPQQFTLTVQKGGNGTGKVTSIPGGIDCGSDCTEQYNAGSQVTLTANASPGSVFSGWSGSGCSGTGTCTITMDADRTVTANFSKEGTSSTSPPNNDGDGLPDSIEQGPDGNNPDYDGNGDHIPDWKQSNVTSFPTYTEGGSHYLTIELPQGQSFRNVQTTRNFPNPPPWVSFPYGYFSFKIMGLQPGGCTTVTIYLDGEAPQTYYKYGPTPDKP